MAPPPLPQGRLRTRYETDALIEMDAALERVTRAHAALSATITAAREHGSWNSSVAVLQTSARALKKASGNALVASNICHSMDPEAPSQ